MRTLPLPLLLLLLLDSCTSPSTCERFFEPYPDLITGRERSVRNAVLLDAMAHYSSGDHAAAIEGIQTYIEKDPSETDAARFYLANSLLALGRPYDAELQLDFVERSPAATFHDEVDWYSALCLLCSGQNARALEAAQRIANNPRHRYRPQAAKLVAALE